MGFASCYEDNLDARGESLRRFSRQHTKKTEKEPTVSESKKSQRTQRKISQFKLRRSADSTRVNKITLRKKKSQPQKSQRTQPKQSLKPLQQKATHNIRQDIRRRELQKTLRVPVQKTQRVTTEEIQRRIQREIIRQSSLEE